MEKKILGKLKEQYLRKDRVLNVLDKGAHHDHYSLLVSGMLQSHNIPHNIYASAPLQNNSIGRD